MTKIKNGGPAFPTSDGLATDGEREVTYTSTFPGLSIRDWFAGQALSNIVWGTQDQHAAANFAVAAYTIADAMLAAREADPS